MIKKILRVATVFCLSLAFFADPIAPTREAHALAAVVDVTTQHNDNRRTGANLNETTLTTANVNASSFGRLFSQQVDGQIYAQPLYLSQMDIGGKTRNVVYVATMHNTLYCFDADDGSLGPLWTKSLDPSVKLPDANIGPAGYADIKNEIGILSTPVISRDRGVIYLTLMTVNSAKTQYKHRLYALDLKNGSIRQGPVDISATVAGTADGGTTVRLNSMFQLQRTALTLANGRVQMGFGSIGDNGNYHGWVLGYNANTFVQEVAYTTSPNGEWGGVWMSGQGLTVDPAGNLYFLSGNLSIDVLEDDANKGNAVIKLSNGSPAQLLDWFIPFNYEELDLVDLDLGSSGVMLIPGTGLLICGSKGGKLYLLDSNNLGKFQAGSDSQIVQSFFISTGNIHGAPVYWEGPAGKQIYVWAEEDTLKAFKFDGTRLQPAPASQSVVKLPDHTMPGGFLSVSADGNKAGTGIVWASSPVSEDANHATVEGVLRAFDASDLSRELWNSKQSGRASDIYNFAKFAPPTIANGKVYMATFSNRIDVYGLTGGTTSTTKAEAENATLTIAKVNWDHAGYSGTGFVDNYNTGNVGATTTFTVDMASAGAADVTLRYGNGMGSAMTVSLYVNGTKIKQTTLPPTANWDTWGDKTETLNLVAGTNTIAYRYDSGDTGNVNLDYLSIAGGTVVTPPTSTTKAEAEDATLTIAKVNWDHTGYSGTGFVDNYNTGNVGATTTFTVNMASASAGAADVTLRYGNGMGSAMTVSLYVNGTKIKQTSLPPTANWDTWGDKTETLNLVAGTNTIAYRYDSGDTGNVNLDYLSYAGGTVVTPPTSTTKAEAENATLTIAKVNWDHAGYSGTGFVDNYNTGNVGATTTFTVNMASAGAADVTLRYGNGMGSAMTVSLYVNGTKIKQTSLPPTANWDTWGDKTETLNLAAGTNTIAYRYDSGDSGNVNLDYLSIAGGTVVTPPTPTTKAEAEDATLTIAKVNWDHTGYSGTGFVDNYNTGNVGATTTFTVDMASAGAADVTLRYGNGMGSAMTVSLYVNGTKIKQTSLPPTANWDTWGDKTETLNLAAGTNTIAYRYDSGDTGNVNLDFIALSASS